MESPAAHVASRPTCTTWGWKSRPLNSSGRLAMMQALPPAEHRKHGEVIQFLLALMATLERQGLRPNAVLIEDAANGPAVCQLLRRQVPGFIAIPRPRAARPPAPMQWPPEGDAVQLVIAFPAKPRRHRPVNPHAVANALALQHRDISATVAGNISRRTGHQKDNLKQITMFGIIQAACRYSQERGSFRPYARAYANRAVYYYLLDKRFLIKVPASW
jgi:hypothetical protein